MKNRLPLLNFVDSLYPTERLDEVLVVACQHLLETTIDLFDALIEKGLKPENVHLIGKCYSTNPSVFDELRLRGIKVSDLSSAYDSHESFDEQFSSYIGNFCEKAQEVDFSKFSKIVVLDDGGALLLCMNESLEFFDNVVGIEQTASGYEKLKSKKLNFPIINIAKSKAKLEVESPFIAEIIVKKIKEYLNEIGMENLKIVIVGQGAIGGNLHGNLKKEFNTIKYDIVTHEHPFPGEYEKDLQDFDVIIGATGNIIITKEYFGKLKRDVVLVSASSSDREFSAVELRKLVDRNTDCHKNIQVNGIRILNSGFPINFDGTRDSVAFEKIQFTRALLMAGVLQSVSGKYGENTFIDLDEAVQEKIISEFESYKI